VSDRLRNVPPSTWYRFQSKSGSESFYQKNYYWFFKNGNPDGNIEILVKNGFKNCGQENRVLVNTLGILRYMKYVPTTPLYVLSGIIQNVYSLKLAIQSSIDIQNAPSISLTSSFSLVCFGIVSHIRDLSDHCPVNSAEFPHGFRMRISLTVSPLLFRAISIRSIE